MTTRPIHKLTDEIIAGYPIEGKACRLSDGQGLYLEVKSSGRKGWRFEYYFKKEKRSMRFGVYPKVSLVEAREMTLLTRAQVKNGVDPRLLRNKGKQAGMDLQSTLKVNNAELEKKRARLKLALSI